MVHYIITYGNYGGTRSTLSKKFRKKSTANAYVQKLKRQNKNPYAKKHFDPRVLGPMSD